MFHHSRPTLRSPLLCLTAIHRDDRIDFTKFSLFFRHLFVSYTVRSPVLRDVEVWRQVCVYDKTHISTCCIHVIGKADFSYHFHQLFYNTSRRVFIQTDTTYCINISYTLRTHLTLMCHCPSKTGMQGYLNVREVCYHTGGCPEILQFVYSFNGGVL